MLAQKVQMIGGWIVSNQHTDRDGNISLQLELDPSKLPKLVRLAQFAGLFIQSGMNTYMFNVEADLGEGMIEYVLHYSIVDPHVPPFTRRSDSSNIVRTQYVRKAGRVLAINLTRRLPNLYMLGCQQDKANNYLLTQWHNAPWK